MAVYKLGISATRRKGSKGGSTFQKTANGYVIRWRAVPVQKRTPKQSQVKNRFENIAGRWRTLSVADQTSFETGAPSFPRIDSLGNSYDLTGQALQQSSNLNLLTSNQTLVSNLPGSSGFPAWNILSAAVQWGVFQQGISIDIGNVPAGMTMQFYTLPMSAVNISSGSLQQMKLYQTLPAGSALNLDTYAEWIKVIGTVPPFPADELWMAVTMTEISTGQIDAPQFVRAFVEFG